MERLLDEFDQQEMHLRRLGRRIDQHRGQLGQTEFRIGRRLQDELESEFDPVAWGEGGPPPGWPDATLIFITRSRVQQRLIVEVAAEVEALGADRFQEEIRNELQHALDRMPHAMDAHFHDAGPMVVPPGSLSRDFLELALNSQQEALLKVDLALDRLE